MRLTLLYSGLFLLLGTTVIAVIVVLTGHSPLVVHVSGSAATATARAEPVPQGAVPVHVNELINGVSAQRSADFARVFTASWAVLIVTTIGSAVLGWFAAGRVLRPLRAITATARTISAGNLHERLALTGPEDEFKALGDTLDDLLARLEASFDAQRRFVANASHELRTPLTLERTLLQVALADPNASTETLRATGQELLELQTEHERMLEALLTLASSERALECREAIDLPVLVEAALHRVAPAVAEKGLELYTSLEGPATIRGGSRARRAPDREPDRQRGRAQRSPWPDRGPNGGERRWNGRAEYQQHRTPDPAGSGRAVVRALPASRPHPRQPERPPWARPLDRPGDRFGSQRAAQGPGATWRRPHRHRRLSGAGTAGQPALMLVLSCGVAASVW